MELGCVYAGEVRGRERDRERDSASYFRDIYEGAERFRLHYMQCWIELIITISHVKQRSTKDPVGLRLSNKETFRSEMIE